MSRYLEIQTNHKFLTPDGEPSHHVYDENKKNVAAFVKLEDALLFVAAVAKAEGRETFGSEPEIIGNATCDGCGNTNTYVQVMSSPPVAVGICLCRSCLESDHPNA